MDADRTDVCLIDVFPPISLSYSISINPGACRYVLYQKNIWHNQEIQFEDQFAFGRCIIVLIPLDLVPLAGFGRSRHTEACYGYGSGMYAIKNICSPLWINRLHLSGICSVIVRKFQYELGCCGLECLWRNICSECSNSRRRTMCCREASRKVNVLATWCDTVRGWGEDVIMQSSRTGTPKPIAG